MTGNGMGDAVMAAVQALNPNWNKMSSAEQAQMQAYFRAIYGAVVAYIQANADVLPAGHSGPGLQNPAGQPVLVSLSTGSGSTTAPDSITGKGSVS